MKLTCHQISFRYPQAAFPVFSDLNYDLLRPGFNALFGPSGVGKTSLARIITGDLSPSSGEVSLEGEARIAYTYNLERLPGWSPVGHHIDKITPEGKAPLKEELIGIFQLEKCLHLRFSQLSLGQKNRVNLIRYLLQDFHLLILDESLANVDEPTRQKIILHIKRLFPETFFLYISHNVMEVATLCREILVLRGPRKTPQSRTVPGLDQQLGGAAPAAERDRVMLEIMNAA